MKSAIHRIAFPERYYASYASSAPLAFQYDMPMYLGHIGEVLNNTSYGGGNVRKRYLPHWV